MDMPTVAEALHTSLDVVHLTVCLFVAGFGVGPLFFAPLSEIVGRKPVIFISMSECASAFWCCVHVPVKTLTRLQAFISSSASPRHSHRMLRLSLWVVRWRV